MTVTNDVAEMSGVVSLTSADVTLDTNRRDCSFNIRPALYGLFPDCLKVKLFSYWCFRSCERGHTKDLAISGTISSYLDFLRIVELRGGSSILFYIRCCEQDRVATYDKSKSRKSRKGFFHFYQESHKVVNNL